MHEPKSQFVLDEGLNILSFSKFIVAACSHLFGVVTFEIELGLDPDVFGAGDEHGGVVVHADFVSGPEGLGYFDLSQEGVLVLPGGGSFLIFKDECKDEESLVGHGDGIVEGEANKLMIVLQYPDEMHGEY